MPRKPIDATMQAEKRASVAALHEAGNSANQIAKLLGVNVSTVSRWGKADGVSFARERTRAAVAAHRVDLAAMRAELAQGFLEDAAWVRDQMRSPGERVSGNGTLVGLSKADAGDVRNWMTAAGIAAQRSVELSKVDADPGEGLPAVDQWLAHMSGDTQ